MFKEIRLLSSLIFLAIAVTSTSAQPYNFLLGQSWESQGDATIEKLNDTHCFVVRNGGSFTQIVALPDDAVGQYIVLIGRGSSERIHPDDSITDLPYLYGYILDNGIRRQERILTYLQGMLGRSKYSKELVTMSGIFKVPEKGSMVRFFLNQALGQGIDRDGSAARFTDVGMYLFPTEEGAKSFVQNKNRTN
jgi:hypothetical protein